MKLVKLVFEQYFIDPWGHKSFLGGYRVVEMVEVWPNEEVKYISNGYEPPYPCPVFEADDGRTWLEVHDHVAYFNCIWYNRLFDEPRDPALGKHEIGPSTKWVTYDEAVKTKLVNAELQPVDIDGNRLG